MANKILLELKPGRDAQGGFLFIKSEYEWPAMRSSTGNMIVSVSGGDLGGVPTFQQPTNSPVSGLPFQVGYNLNVAKLFVGDKLNVGFLAARDIRAGVTYRIEGVCSVDKMKLFTVQMREFAKKIYVEQMKPVSFRVTLTTSEEEIIP